VFLGNGWDDEGWVKGDEGGSKRSEFAVSSSYFDVLGELAIVATRTRTWRAYSGANGVGYVAASTLSVLAGMDNLDVEVGVFVEYLLDTTMIAALLGLDSTRLG
jgi:hypothetical protein